MTLAAFDGTLNPTVTFELYKNGSWTNVSSTDVREVKITRGRQRADLDVQPGTLSITLDNHSGDYDPDNLSGAWVVAGASILRDGLPGRFSLTWSGTPYPLFAGYMETIDLDAGFDASATFTFVDGLAFIARAFMPALSSFQHSGETTSTRVTRYLNSSNVNYSRFSQNINGSVQMQSTTEGLNVIELIKQCVAAEAGAFYVSKNGTATMLTLTDKFSRPTQLTFDDNPSHANTVEYDSIKTTPGSLQVINQAIIMRGKLPQVSVTKTSSVTAYGLKTLVKECLVLSASTAHKLATYYAVKDASPTTTVSQITFNAFNLGTLFPDFLSSELQDQVTVKRTTVDGRNLTMYLVIEGIDLHLSVNEFSATYYTSPMNSTKVVLP